MQVVFCFFMHILVIIVLFASFANAADDIVISPGGTRRAADDPLLGANPNFFIPSNGKAKRPTNAYRTITGDYYAFVEGQNSLHASSFGDE